MYADAAAPAETVGEAAAWAVVPEACIRHAGVGPVAAAQVGCQPWLVANGWWTAATRPTARYGQVLSVLASGRWQLGEVRKQLRRLGLERLNVSSADSRLDAQRVQRDLKLPQGGDVRLLLQPDAKGRRHWLLGQTVSSNAEVGDHVLPS